MVQYVSRECQARCRSALYTVLHRPQRWRRNVRALSRDIQAVFVSTEVAPWSKAGGLGDVLDALPVALAKRGLTVMTVAPAYEAYLGTTDCGISIPIDLAVDSSRPDLDCEVVEAEPSLHVAQLRIRVSKGVLRAFVTHPFFSVPGTDIYSVYTAEGQARDVPAAMDVLCQAAIAASCLLWYNPSMLTGWVGGPLVTDEQEAWKSPRTVPQSIFVGNDWPTGLLPLQLLAWQRAAPTAPASCTTQMQHAPAPGTISPTSEPVAASTQALVKANVPPQLEAFQRLNQLPGASPEDAEWQQARSKLHNMLSKSLEAAKAVMCIHNIAYQGVFDGDTAQGHSLPPRLLDYLYPSNEEPPHPSCLAHFGPRKEDIKAQAIEAQAAPSLAPAAASTGTDDAARPQASAWAEVEAVLAQRTAQDSAAAHADTRGDSPPAVPTTNGTADVGGRALCACMTSASSGGDQMRGVHSQFLEEYSRSVQCVGRAGREVLELSRTQATLLRRTWPKARRVGQHMPEARTVSLSALALITWHALLGSQHQSEPVILQRGLLAPEASDAAPPQPLRGASARATSTSRQHDSDSDDYSEGEQQPPEGPLWHNAQLPHTSGGSTVQHRGIRSHIVVAEETAAPHTATSQALKGDVAPTGVHETMPGAHACNTPQPATQQPGAFEQQQHRDSNNAAHQVQEAGVVLESTKRQHARSVQQASTAAAPHAAPSHANAPQAVGSSVAGRKRPAGISDSSGNHPHDNNSQHLDAVESKRHLHGPTGDVRASQLPIPGTSIDENNVGIDDSSVASLPVSERQSKGHRRATAALQAHSTAQKGEEKGAGRRLPPPHGEVWRALCPPAHAPQPQRGERQPDEKGPVRRVVNWLLGGLRSAAALVTVSHAYACEIQTDEQQAMGLLPALKGKRIHGIINGINTTTWDPTTDPLLAPLMRYTPSKCAKGKAAAKLWLQDRFDLPKESGVPMVAFVGRLTEQKGVDVLLKALFASVGPEGLAASSLARSLATPGGRGKQAQRRPMRASQRDFQTVIMGTGDSHLENELRFLARSLPGRAAGSVGFDERLAHRILAAADILVVPSRFEPCGLVALAALRYGAVPVVASTGGLRDIVTGRFLLGTSSSLVRLLQAPHILSHLFMLLFGIRAAPMPQPAWLSYATYSLRVPVGMLQLHSVIEHLPACLRFQQNLVSLISLRRDTVWLFHFMVAAAVAGVRQAALLQGGLGDSPSPPKQPVAHVFGYEVGEIAISTDVADTNASVQRLHAGLLRAVNEVGTPRFRRMQQAGMHADVSWGAPAASWHEVLLETAHGNDDADADDVGLHVDG